MRKFAALLCLTIAVLLFSAGEGFALPPCPPGDDESKWQNCEGILTDHRGKYVGVFKDEIFDGKNAEKGIRYVGEYKNGKWHGQGTHTWADGEKYVGEFRDGKRNGQGTYTFASGDKYVGEYRDGKRNGQGTHTFASGDKYVGENRDGKWHGLGTYTFADGRVKEGVWKNDAFQYAKKDPKVEERRKAELEAESLSSRIINSLEVEPETRVAAAPVVAQAVKALKNRDAVAVIIGNKNYASAHYSVAYAHNDADAIREFVEKRLGYRDGNIIDLRDATAGDFMSVFGTEKSHEGKLFDWVRANQSDVIVYYSGHGVPGLKDGRGYLLPVDGDPNRARLTGYPLELLLNNLAKIPARSITVYLDACFSGGSHRGMLVRSASPILVTPKDVEGSQRMTVLTAASGDQLASWDEDKKHGLFTWHLLEALSGTADRGFYGDGDGEVVVSEVKKYLDAEMTYQARRRYGREQNVWISGEMERVLVQLGSQQN